MTEAAEETVSVVIATYRDQPGPLAAVVARYLDQGADEVVVVLDGPQPCSRAALDDITDVRLVVHELEHNRGPALARLAGVRMATSRLVITADDDILIDDGVVARQRSLHAGRCDLVVVGLLPVQPRPGDPDEVTSRLFDAEYRSVIERWEREPETILQGLYGGLVSTPRALFLCAEAYMQTVPLPYFEDLDLGLRLAAVGATARFDMATAGRHLHRATLTAFARQSRARRRSLETLEKRWGTVPEYTRLPETALVRRTRDLYRVASRVPGVRPVAERASLWWLRAVSRAHWTQVEVLAARVLRGVQEAAEDAVIGGAP